MFESYPVNQKLWIPATSSPIPDDVLKRLTVLVPPKERSYRRSCEYEVLVFTTEIEWAQCQDEKEMKKRIAAKFRSYGDAEEYAQQQLLVVYHFKVVLRA